ncbi:MAG: hypothetical protein U1A25_02085 [Candidatus Sungbacteria bacterium]|nr:hypothetical protein [bacterium]MDZ4260430.1 hypothetical protein [Candidatus Sungbacteria bacterium]
MSLERRVEEHKKGGIGDQEQKTPKKSGEVSPELESYREQAQRMIDSYRRFFMTYAKDVSLQFHLSNKFYTDLEHGHVNLDTRWFAKKDASHEQILWAILHELSHFRDLAEDPQGMKNFEYIKNQAKKTGAMMMKKWEAAYGQTDPEFIGRLKQRPPADPHHTQEGMNAVEQAAYQFHHTFFNVLDDIYVNNLLTRKAPVYEEGSEGGESVKDLYKHKLFPETDYTKIPRHLQFIYTLIREEMVSDEPVVVSAEVEGLLSKKIKFQGREYTPKELVEPFLKPKSGRNTKASYRYIVIRNTLEPIFLDLLKKDIDEWQPKKPEPRDDDEGQGAGEGMPSEGSINPFDAPYQQFKENSPDQLDDHDIEAWTKKFHEDQEKGHKAQEDEDAENAKTQEQRAREAQDAMDRAWCGEHNIDYAIFEEFKKIEQEVAPYLADLSRFWQSIIYGSSRRQERGMEGYFPTGELDIPKVIEQWPKIQQGDLHETAVMRRMVSREAVVKKPELIRVRILGDMSGSMEYPKEKKHLLQQCLVLILSSLREFNSYLNMTRSHTKSKMETDTQAWIYGTEPKVVKRLRKDIGIQEEQKEIITIFSQAQETLGDTHDEKPLKIIFDSLSQTDRERIAQKKIMEIVLEITDGGSTKPALTRHEVDRLENIGVILAAFQIGKVGASEQAAFHVVWNENREEPLGTVVGEHIENLLPALTQALKKYLQGVVV